MVVSKTKSKSKIIHVEQMPDDPRRRRPDITKAKQILGWEPIVQLDQGMGKTIEWFQKNKNFYN